MSAWRGRRRPGGGVVGLTGALLGRLGRGRTSAAIRLRVIRPIISFLGCPVAFGAAEARSPAQWGRAPAQTRRTYEGMRHTAPGRKRGRDDASPSRIRRRAAALPGARGPPAAPPPRSDAPSAAPGAYHGPGRRSVETRAASELTELGRNAKRSARHPAPATPIPPGAPRVGGRLRCRLSAGGDRTSRRAPTHHQPTGTARGSWDGRGPRSRAMGARAASNAPHLWGNATDSARP